MKRVFSLGVCAIALAGCEKTDPLYCGKHPDSCNDGGGLLADAATQFSISGTVTGLGTASGLVLQNNGADDKPVVSDGSFRFSTPVDLNGTYEVTVSVQPTNPSETCAVTKGSGTATADVTDVTVTCAPAAYTIGGTVFGLTGSLNLMNGTDTLNNVMNGPFTFGTPVQSGKPYNVTSSSGSCPVFGGTGTVGNGNVTTVIVNCGTTGPYAIGGMVSGLNGSVVLKNSTNNDTVTLNANGAYAFPMLVPSAGNYSVSVMTNPAYPPANQTCSVTNGSGQANGNVQNINVTCTTNSFTVGGMVTGVTGTVVLKNNGGDDTTLSGSSYKFPTALLSGAPYAVTVSQKPASLACSISNATGTVGNGNVNNVNVSCAYQDPGIQCGTGTYCGTGQECCYTGTFACVASGTCGSTTLKCDSKADCTGSNICCEQTNGGHNQLGNSSCKSSSSCSSSGSVEVLCDLGNPTPCSSGTCQAWQDGYYSCR